ncbi:condensin-2 complex subunit G2, putative, partial [Hepatocystis sp. ex Piliocolobus tephrosceles]
VLKELWEIINEDKRTAFINVLVNRLIKLKSCEGVKSEVISGFCDLAKNKKINKFFYKIFNKMKYLMFDKNVKVRKNFITLILELNENLDENFSSELEYSELIKIVTKDFLIHNVHCCVKKMRYARLEDHKKLKKRQVCFFLDVASRLVTYSIWKNNIKEQAKDIMNLINEYPIFMICVSKYCSDLKLLNRYKLAAVLFDIVNAKLREEEENAILLKKNKNNYIWECDELFTEHIGIININQTHIIKDENIKKKHIRYGSLLYCIANFLKTKNDKELDVSESEEIQQFLKQKFIEPFFIDSLNTLLQPHYFKILKSLNLDYTNFINIYKYCIKQLNTLCSDKTNIYFCKRFIIPLFYKWRLLNDVTNEHMSYLGYLTEQLELCIKMYQGDSGNGSGGVDSGNGSGGGGGVQDGHVVTDHTNNISSDISNHNHNHNGNVSDIGITSDGSDGDSITDLSESENDKTINVQKMTNNKKKKKIDIEKIKQLKEMNTLTFIFIIIQKKKYRQTLFRTHGDLIYNYIHKFSFYLLHTFKQITANEFSIPTYFISQYNYEINQNKVDIIPKLFLNDEKQIKGYMQVYISLFFIFQTYSNYIVYSWDVILQNIVSCIELINSLKFEKELQIITFCLKKKKKKNITIASVKESNVEENERVMWSTYIKMIICYLLYFLDMIEFIIVLKKILVEDIELNGYMRTIFLFYKCYEIINMNNCETVVFYLKIWNRMNDHIYFLFNTPYFDKSPESRLLIIYTFFLFTNKYISKKSILRMVSNYSSVATIKKNILNNHLKNFVNHTETVNYMRPKQVSLIQRIVDSFLAAQLLEPTKKR